MNTRTVSPLLTRLTAIAVAAGGLALAGCSRADRAEVRTDTEAAVAQVQQSGRDASIDARQASSEMKADARATGSEIRADAREAGSEIKADAREAGAEIKAETREAGAAIRDKANEVTANAGARADAANDSMKAKASELKDDAGNLVDKAKVAIADGAITAGVKAELAKDPVLKARNINVDTEQGRVMLRGTAPSADAKAKATQLARSVDGVKSVSNQLTVGTNPNS